MPTDLTELTDTEEPTRGRRGDISTLPLIFGTVAVLCLAVVLSIAALAAADDDDSSASTGAASVHVSLSEFAIDPGSVTVGAEGTVHVSNDGTAAHNLSIADTDLTTPDLAAGETGELDVSSLEPGSYELLCLIAGHADAGMTAALEITAGPETAAPDGRNTPLGTATRTTPR